MTPKISCTVICLKKKFVYVIIVTLRIVNCNLDNIFFKDSL